jgi:DNA-binding response OmpR family regulator
LRDVTIVRAQPRAYTRHSLQSRVIAWITEGQESTVVFFGCYDLIVKVLIVEDEFKTATYLRKGLSEHGYVADVASNGEDGLYLAQNSEYDLLILDVMLPSRDGWSVMSELRRSGKQTPVLFLTARDSVPDRVKGLELGADDYLVKPFAFSELLARIRTILRRGPVRRSESLRFRSASAGWPIRPSARWMRCSEMRLKSGDCSSCTDSRR